MLKSTETVVKIGKRNVEVESYPLMLEKGSKMFYTKKRST